MKANSQSLFKLVVDAERQHPKHKLISEASGQSPARWMLDKVFKTYEDVDGNFVEQFQSEGFNARFFEIYLHAYFSRSGYKIGRPKPAPDYLVSRAGIEVAIEATTLNPSRTGALADFGIKIEDLTQDQIKDYTDNELAIRFGSALFSKLNKKYWEQPHCKDKPLVIAVEAFHDDGALGFSDYTLARYLYGLEQKGEWTADGILQLEHEEVQEHVLGSKTIPSRFFGQPNTEHISAVLFSNSGATGKFQRMGYMHGIGNDQLTMIRSGYAHDPNPNARDGMYFSYDLDQPPVIETWGQGLVVMHNPNCLNPLPKGFFKDAIDSYIEEGSYAADIYNWHPISSINHTFDYKKGKTGLRKLPYRTPNIGIISLDKEDFQAIVGINHDNNPFFDEVGWFTDATESFVAVLVHDKTDKDWGAIILARDLTGKFCAIVSRVQFSTREEAKHDMYQQMSELLHEPKRYFEQGHEFDHLKPESKSTKAKKQTKKKTRKRKK